MTKNKIKILGFLIHAIAITFLVSLLYSDGYSIHASSNKALVWGYSFAFVLLITFNGFSFLVLIRDKSRKWLFNLLTIFLLSILWSISFFVFNPESQTSLLFYFLIWFVTGVIHMFVLTFFAGKILQPKSYKSVLLNTIAISLSLMFAINLLNPTFETTWNFITKPSEIKLMKVLKSDDFHIKRVIYGGIGGRGESNYHYISQKYDTLLIMDEGTNYQEFVKLTSEKRNKLKQYLIESFKSHDPNNVLMGSCMNFETEIQLRSGFNLIYLKPINDDFDSLFYHVILKN